jgi:dTDP-4-dehydrorhamnose 3,5-epimerase
MKFIETRIAGVVVVEPEWQQDPRGGFARTFCESEFKAHGLAYRFVQSSVSYNQRKGTLRGMHYQVPPGAEAKLVHCTAGAIFDVALDLRAPSSSFTEWVGIELTAANHRQLYIPVGCAHGYQTLEEESEVEYQISAAYSPDLARGILWDDPAFAIAWPVEPQRRVSVRDSSFPPFSPMKDGLIL